MGRDLQQEDHIIIWGLTGFIVIVVGFYISQPHVQPTSIQPVGQKVNGILLRLKTIILLSTGLPSIGLSIFIGSSTNLIPISECHIKPIVR